MDKHRCHVKGRDGVGGGGRLKQRLAQIFLHSSCTTTSVAAVVSLAKTNAAPANAASSRQEPPPAAGPCSHEPRPKIDGSRRRRRRRSSRALVHISIDCSGTGAADTTSARRSARSVSAALLPSPTPAKDVKAVKIKARNGNGNKPLSPSYSCSSSAVTDDELATFSSDGERGEEEEDDETRSTLFSSLGFSSDSTSDFYNTTGHKSTRSKRHKNPPRRVPRRAPPRGAKPADTFRPVVSSQATPKHDKADANKTDKDGGVVGAAGSMAVVKRSHNPYADFRSSMVEMVVERRICSADALGELLVSYMSLNSPRHHPAILAAFEDVWEAVFFSK